MPYRPTEMSKVRNLRRMLRNPRNSAIMTQLVKKGSMSFNNLMDAAGLDNGSMSLYARRLEARGFLSVKRVFIGRTTMTTYSITLAGLCAFDDLLLSCHEARIPTINPTPRRPNVLPRKRKAA